MQCIHELKSVRPGGTTYSQELRNTSFSICAPTRAKVTSVDSPSNLSKRIFSLLDVHLLFPPNPRVTQHKNGKHQFAPPIKIWIQDQTIFPQAFAFRALLTPIDIVQPRHLDIMGFIQFTSVQARFYDFWGKPENNLATMGSSSVRVLLELPRNDSGNESDFHPPLCSRISIPSWI